VSTSALVGLKRMINEGRLNDLPDEHLLDIKNRRFLPTVYEYPITPAQTKPLVTLQEELLAA
jgi:hypothetical protein